MQTEARGPLKKKPRSHTLPRGLEIIYEDNELIVVNKPAGLLTMGTETKKAGTVYYYLTDYVRKGSKQSRNRIFIVHRLDKLTSGVLVFAKNQELKLRLQEQWERTRKRYIAVVHGQFEQKEGVITSYLAENKALVVYSTTNSKIGKLSHTGYRVLKENSRFSLVEIDLITGRKNQIRVHMADVGHPIVGDEKYGRKNSRYKHLMLHAKSISFKNPFTGKLMTFDTRTPEAFNSLLAEKPSTVSSDIIEGPKRL